MRSGIKVKITFCEMKESDLQLQLTLCLDHYSDYEQDRCFEEGNTLKEYKGPTPCS